MLGLAASLAKGGASLLTYVKDNLKLYLDFKSNRSDTLAFPSEGSTSFNGSSNYIDCGANVHDFSSGDFSCTAWIYHDIQNSENATILGDRDSTNTELLFYVHKTTEKLTSWNGSTDVASSSTIADEVWTHVAMVQDGSNKKFYINGVLDATASQGNGTSRPSTLKIGFSSVNNEYFKGKLANIGVWSRVLSLEEINSVMNKSYSQLGSVEKTSLVSWWALDNAELGDELWDEDASAVGSSVHSWTTFAGATMIPEGGAIKIAHSASSGFGAYVFLKDADSDLKDNLTVGKAYKLTFDAKVDTGTVKVTQEETDNFVEVSETSFTTKTLYFVATHAYNDYIVTHEGQGSIIWLDNFSLKSLEIPDSKGSNTGTPYGIEPTTSVYGGNAPILPRAIDIAESQAEAIGNGSASFNGSSDYIRILHSDNLSTPKGFTITAWIKANSDVTDWRGIIAKRDATNDSNYLIYVNKTTGVFGSYDTSTELLGTQTLNDNTWHHVAISNDGSNTIMYVNGIVDKTGTQSAYSTNTLDVVIGEAGWNGSAPPGDKFLGNIAQVGIWQGILTQAKIQSVMESTSYAKIPADVKSTLGSELITKSVTDSWTGSGLTVNEASTEQAFSGTQSLKFVTGSGAGHKGVTSNSFTSVLNALYKIDFYVYTTDSDIEIRAYQGDGSGTSLNESISVASNQWVHVVKYYIEDGGGSFSSISFGNNTTSVTTYIDNISVKKVTNDLVAYYPLDADSEVKGLDFNGTGDHINCGSDTSLALATDFTISVWFNSDDVTGYERLVNRGNYNAGFIFGLNDDNLDFTFRDADDTSHTALAGGTNMTANRWYHGVAVSNSSTGKVHVYLNGVDDGNASITHPIQTPSADFRIGSDGSSHFNGKISSVSVYNVVKTEQEIKAIYDDGIGGDESSNSGLVGYWKLDNATTVVDLSSNSNNGTVTGATLIGAGTTDSVGNNDGGLV